MVTWAPTAGGRDIIALLPLFGEGTDLVALSLHVCEWFFVPTEKGFQRLRDGSFGVMCVSAWGGGRDREG